MLTIAGWKCWDCEIMPMLTKSRAKGGVVKNCPKCGCSDVEPCAFDDTELYECCRCEHAFRIEGDVVTGRNFPPARCGICNGEIIGDNFNESQGVLIHQSCYDYYGGGC